MSPVGRRLVALWALVIGGLACAGVRFPAANAEGLEACRAYRARYDALPCTPEDLPPDFCPAELANTDCDYASYYRCMMDGIRCKDAWLDATGQLACTVQCS